ncbi:hypothetical protein MKX03_031434 [Papaver bracteatum]|nr:hypothetical protein MKX03_031434 [Papaver bracteatum]
MISRDNFLLNILQSMGQAIIIFDATGMVTYWNRSAENLYGYSASEALGQDVLDLIVVREAREDAMHLLRKNASEGKWTGIFQVKNKQGERIFVHITITPLYDDNGTIVGIICVSADAQDFLQTPPISSSKVNSTSSRLTSKPDHNDDYQQPLQVVVTSCGACTLTGDGDVPCKAPPVEKLSGRKFGGYCEKGEGKTEIHKINTSTAVASISKKNISSWPWIASQHDGLVARTIHHHSFACMRDEQENDFVRPKSSSSSYGKPEVQVIGVVGFMDQRLEIPKDTDPKWASLIESCWQSEPKCRPTFNELQENLKTLQKRWSVQKPISKTRLARVSDASTTRVISTTGIQTHMHKSEKRK